MKKLIYVFLACVIQSAITLGEAVMFQKSIEYFPDVNQYVSGTAFSIIWLASFRVLFGLVFKQKA